MIASNHTVVLQADATYKLIWQGNPVLIIGITDTKNQFHPILIAVCSNETHNDYHFIFSALNKGIQLIGNSIFIINYYISHFCVLINLFL